MNVYRVESFGEDLPNDMSGDGFGYHVLDERGRTVAVFYRARGASYDAANMRAREYCDLLNSGGARTVQRRTRHEAVLA